MAEWFKARHLELNCISRVHPHRSFMILDKLLNCHELNVLIYKMEVNTTPPHRAVERINQITISKILSTWFRLCPIYTFHYYYRYCYYYWHYFKFSSPIAVVSQFCFPCLILFSYKIAGLSAPLEDKDWLHIFFPSLALRLVYCR